MILFALQRRVNACDAEFGDVLLFIHPSNVQLLCVGCNPAAVPCRWTLFQLTERQGRGRKTLRPAGRGAASLPTGVQLGRRDPASQPAAAPAATGHSFVRECR